MAARTIRATDDQRAGTARRALLIIELKTEIVDIGELLGTLDRKCRRGAEIARPYGWRHDTVSRWLIVGEGMMNRRRVARHMATFAAALPARAMDVRAWLRRPPGPIAALTFFADGRPGKAGTGFATVRRASTRSRRQR